MISSVLDLIGASSGIGRTTALHFAAQGALLALFSRKLSALEETKALASKYFKNPDTDVLICLYDFSKQNQNQ